MGEPRAAGQGRNLTWWQFLLLVLGYAAIIQVGGRVIGADVDSDEGWQTAGNMLEAAVIPIALSSVFVVGLATWLVGGSRSSTSLGPCSGGSGSSRSRCC